MKFNKQGFTLIELIIVISLLSVVVLMFANNMEGINRSTTEKSYNRMVSNIKMASEAYVAYDQKIEDEIKYGKGYYNISIKDLIENGFLDKNTRDPRTDKPIDRDELVSVFYNDQGKYSNVFPVENVDLIEYMESTPIVVNIFPLDDLSYYDFQGLNTPGLRLINGEGVVKTLTRVTTLNNPYEITVASKTFAYLDNGMNEFNSNNIGSYLTRNNGSEDNLIAVRPANLVPPGVYKIIYNFRDGNNNSRQHIREVISY